MNTITNVRNIVIESSAMTTNDIGLGTDNALYVAETHGKLKYVAPYDEILGQQETANVAYAAGTAGASKTTIGSSNSATAGNSITYTLHVQQDGNFGTAKLTEVYNYTTAATGTITSTTVAAALIAAAAGSAIGTVEAGTDTHIIKVTGTVNGGGVNIWTTVNSTSGLTCTNNEVLTAYVAPKGTAAELTFYGLTYTGSTYNRVTLSFTKTSGMGVDGAPIKTKWCYNYWLLKDGAGVDTMYTEFIKYLNGTSAYVTFVTTSPLG